MEPGTVPGTATRVVPPGRVQKLRRILADALPTLGRVHGVVRLPAWDLAVECVDEALAAGAVPSLERLGRLGQLGSLPSFIAALDERRRSRRGGGRLRPRAGEPRARSGRDHRRASRARARAGTARRSRGARGRRPLRRRLRRARDGRARRQRPPRSADRTSQPSRVSRAALARGRAGAPLPGKRGARPLRPRQLQGHERPRGPPGGRPPPAGVRLSACRHAARDRRRGPGRRRRVRGAATDGPVRRRRRVRRPGSGRGFPTVSPSAPARHIFRPSAPSAEQLLETADRRLYADKTARRCARFRRPRRPRRSARRCLSCRTCPCGPGRCRPRP